MITHDFPVPLPTSLQIETTNRCMLRCPVCATSQAMTRKRGHFPYAQFERLLGEINWGLESCDFGWSGEPFLNPDLGPMIDLCTRRGLGSHVATNGMLLRGYADAVVASQLSAITIGLDGIDQDMLRIYRVGAKFDQITRGIEELVEAKRRAGSRAPHITLQLLVMRHTEQSAGEYVRMARDIGADDVLLKSFNVEEGFWMTPDAQASAAAQFLPCDERYRRLRTAEGGYEVAGGIGSAPCRDVTATPVILWDGRVALCCIDFDAQHTYGNVNEASLRDLWEAEPYRSVRAAAARRLPAMCRRCLYPGSEAFNLRINLSHDNVAPAAGELLV